MSADLGAAGAGILAAIGCFWAVDRFLYSASPGLAILLGLAAGAAATALGAAGWGVGAVFVALAASAEVYRRSGAKPYHPPELIFEGGGIRRGLSAVEAGALFDLDRESLVSLAITELLRKGFLLVEGDGSPLRVKVHPELVMSQETLNPDSRRDARALAAMGLGYEVAGHEDAILELLGEGGAWEQVLAESRHWLAQLHNIVVDKLAGFDLQPTKEYYQAYCQHRLTGVEKGIFQPEDYLTWMVWWALMRTGDKDFTVLLNQTRPGWLDGSMNDWIGLVSDQA